MFFLNKCDLLAQLVRAPPLQGGSPEFDSQRGYLNLSMKEIRQNKQLILNLTLKVLKRFSKVALFFLIFLVSTMILFFPIILGISLILPFNFLFMGSNALVLAESLFLSFFSPIPYLYPILPVTEVNPSDISAVDLWPASRDGGGACTGVCCGR